MNSATAPMPAKAYVLGLPVHLLPNYADWLITQIQQGPGAHVVTINAEMAMQAEQEPKLANIIRQADLVLPDGAGVVLYLRLWGKIIQRCPGIELAEGLLTKLPSRIPNHAVFFYGAAPGVAEQAAVKLQESIPNLRVAGTHHGFVQSADALEVEEMLRSLQPTVILVGLGVPRQEYWIREHRHLCPHAIWIGVGGSFDIWAGVKDRAPTWLRNNHLEWTYRLYKEPWRWRRMLALPRFAWRAAREYASHQ
jgi:N-acetylglucosaminyldiphosphoundecaprenol N-acetyl-beta-D-mannosaminyltransferase